MSEGPLTYADLAARWRCCARQAKRICRRLSLEPMRLGHRTVQFRPADVDRAEERATKFKRSSFAKASENKEGEAA